MARFDAELYLRLVGEAALLTGGGSHGWWSSPVDEAAHALRAIAAIPPARATAVTADYQLALSLRQGHYHPAMSRRHARPRRRAIRPLTFRRVVPVGTTITDQHGRLTIRYVMLGADQVSLSVVRRSAHVSAHRRRGGFGYMRGGGPPWGGPAPTLTDDQGTSVPLDFSGGGSDAEWAGMLTGRAGLPPGARWVALDGHRIGLDAAPAPASVSLEALDESDPARRYLRHRLARTTSPGPDQDIQPAIDALIAAGALAADDPLLAELEAVQARLPHHGFHQRGPGGRSTVPEPWRSLLRRVGREDGPTGTIAIGAGTPPFDGQRVGILSLDSEPSGFAVEVQVAGGSALHPRLAELAWWARDDRGNHYLGASGRWSGGEDYGEGEIEYWPALDPRARRLALMPTGPTHRAVIEVPLEWTPA